MEAHFSSSWLEARDRFRRAAGKAGWSLEAVELAREAPDGSALTIDVARIGAASPARVVVVSSGLHGVEGFMGSAVQLALLRDRSCRLAGDQALLLVHALNPYGFAWIRRVNEDNVDLNRNFLPPGEPYRGSPPGYRALDGMLNPPSPPARLEPFLAHALYNILRHGMPALKAAVAGGQYDFPAGLFFGGARPAQTMQLLDAHLERWIGHRGARVLHVDLHTGLGRSATYRLFVDHERGSEGARVLAERFGGAVEPWSTEGVSYPIRGGLGTWCKGRFPEMAYDVLAAEFGTVGPLQVIAALRAENRAHHHGRPGDRATRRAKARLRAAFCPPSPHWRRAVVRQGLAIVRAALS